MAINDDVPGLKAVVWCGIRQLPELEDPHAEENNGESACPQTTKYIECLDDAEFQVSVSVTPDYNWNYRNHILVIKVYVDGELATSYVLRDSRIYGDGQSTCNFKGRNTYSATTGQWSLNRFKFSPIKTVDDTRKERVETDIKAAKGLGTIEVQFTRAIDRGQTYNDNPHKIRPKAFELAEKSLKGKAISHGTSYGAAVPIRTPNFVDARDLPEDNGPILAIKFMYRSRAALQRELILPRSRSPSPTIDNLTADERDRLARERLRELRAMKTKQEKREPLVKRELDKIVDPTDAPVRFRPTKKIRLGDGRKVDVVDLTDD
ncbi:hypothetical protein F4777DRAFT_436034 [Nemania sp. FL0916]|nr:hypothetical protein F4777DRAFT_436034 [Nemania sp. FL0916]